MERPLMPAIWGEAMGDDNNKRNANSTNRNANNNWLGANTKPTPAAGRGRVDDAQRWEIHDH